MKSKIIYFVLYLVVIAELLVVIHERDLLVDELKGKIDNLQVEKYLDNIILGFSDKETTFILPTEPGAAYVATGFIRNPISDEEKNAGFFYAEIDSKAKADFGNAFPDFLSTQVLDTNKNAYLTRDGANCNLNIQVTRRTFDGSGVRQKFLAQQKVPLTYNLFLKSPRKMPTNFPFGTIDSILTQIMDTSKIAKIKEKYGLKTEQEIKIKQEQIVIRYMLGLEPNQLYSLISQTGERYYFRKTGISNKLSEIEPSITEDVIKDKKKHEEFQKFFRNLFRGDSKYGFDNKEDFYYTITEKIPLTVKLSFYN